MSSSSDYLRVAHLADGTKWAHRTAMQCLNPYVALAGRVAESGRNDEKLSGLQGGR